MLGTNNFSGIKSTADRQAILKEHNEIMPGSLPGRCKMTTNENEECIVNINFAHTELQADWCNGLEETSDCFNHLETFPEGQIKDSISRFRSGNVV